MTERFRAGDIITHKDPAIRRLWGDRYRITSLTTSILYVKPLDKSEWNQSLELTFASLNKIQILESAVKDTFETDGVE